MTDKKKIQRRLRVKNFLTLKDIDCEFDGVNVLIGPQAEGKSLILKLLYFFYENLGMVLGKSLIFGQNIESTYSFSEERFFNIFDITCISTQFEISLLDTDMSLTKITYDRKFNISYTKELELDINNSVKTINKYLLDSKHQETSSLLQNIYPEAIEQHFSIISDSRLVLSSFLSKNIFQYINLGNSYTIDAILRVHAAQHEKARNAFAATDNAQSTETNKHVSDETFTPILKGGYRIIRDDEYILHHDGTKTPLNKTSSGQQEALPILLALRSLQNDSNTIFIGIEEPEAHLYPTAQKQVAEEIIRAFHFRERKTSFCLTTHSPYMLSTLNNCITAAEVLRTEDPEKIARMEEILPREKWISFEHVRCYYIENGTAIDLMDQEYRVIDAERIDKASEQLSTDLAQMLEVLE